MKIARYVASASLALIGLVLFANAQGDQRPSRTQLTPPSTLNRNLYPADADAHADIKAALAGAKKENKNVLLEFGATWCFDCHVLDNAFHKPATQALLDKNFEVVHVDVGKYDKNLDLAKQYEIPLEKGIPAVAILDKNGKLLVSQKNGQFESARSLSEADVYAFLKKWVPSSN